MKIIDDKYYTPIELANYCIDKVLEIISLQNIKYTIEPSCGDGSFFHHKKLSIQTGIDIDPKISGSIITKGDYLSINFERKDGILVIGNPPYGSRMNLAQKFFKHSTIFAEWIAFILPISQLNNTHSLYEFDLIHSEDLGVQDYSGRKLHCCFNIYQRPKNGRSNKPKPSKLQWVKMKRNDAKGYEDFEYDVRMCLWGDGSAGKILTNDEKYSAELKIKIANDCPHKEDVINFIKTFDWKGNMKCIAMKKIQQFHIIDALLSRFPDLK